MSQESENNMCACGWELVEDDMEHVDDWFKPRCENCRDELAEAGVEPGEDEDVESVCCVDCEESFKFDEPVDCLDYHAGRHEMRCPECRNKTACSKCEETDVALTNHTVGSLTVALCKSCCE